MFPAEQARQYCFTSTKELALLDKSSFFTGTKVRILTHLELKAAAPHLDWPAVASLFDTPRFQVETCEGLVLLLDALQLALGT